MRGGRTEIFRTRESSLDPYRGRLEAEWQGGCHVGAELWRRLRAAGFNGSLRVVTEGVTRKRRDEAAKPSGRPRKLPSARVIAKMMTTERDHLSADDARLIVTIEKADHVTAVEPRRAEMERYAGPDVSLKQTAICIVDQAGVIVKEGMVPTDPEAIATFISNHAENVIRAGLESGAISTWLWTELKRMDLPVVCIDARHAKAVLNMQINKSDRNDAAGVARIIQTGWYREVRVKDLDRHAIRSLLASRALLVRVRRDLENQIRGLLKNLGLVIGRAKLNTFTTRTKELIEGTSALSLSTEPLLKARETIGQQTAELDRQVLRLARNDAQARRFMTTPGVGAITTLCYWRPSMIRPASRSLEASAPISA